MTGPLEGIKVFDVTVAAVGPWAAMLLGALGADVIKTEHEKSDVIHNVEPTQRGLGAVYSGCNFSKRGIDLDLKDEKQREVAYQLIRDSDIFMQNMRPGTADRLGFSYERLSEINPRLIYASASAWGLGGPMARMTGSDGPVQAFSGWASMNGAEGGRWEMYRYWGQVDVNSSMYFLLAILQGLLYRARTGEGLRVETSMLGAAIHAQASRLGEYFATGKSSGPLGSASATTAPHQAFLCADGAYLAVGVIREEQWPSLCQALEAEEPLADERFATNPGRVEHRKELASHLEAVFKTKPTRWWELRLTQAGVPNGRFLDLVDCFTHTQYRDNEFLVEMEMPHQGGIFAGNVPWTFSDTKVGYTPAPKPGQHTEEVLREHGIDPMTMESQPGKGRSASSDTALDRRDGKSKLVAGVLEGYRVVDMTQGLCGPLASLMLADAGAEVIKIEPPQGDYARQYGPPFYNGGLSAAFATINRNKKCVILDLTTASGKQALMDLVATADVFLEDLGPGVAEANGYGHESLQKLNPDLVYCSITPFGSRGPFSGRPGAELVVQAMATCCGTLGKQGGPPERLGVDVANMNTASAAAQGVLAALFRRMTGGHGQRVEVSMLGTLVHMRGLIWAAQSNPDYWAGWQCESYTRDPDYAWRAKDRPIYFNLRRGDEEDYYKLLIELGLEENLTDPRFGDGGRNATGHGRYAEELVSIWEQGFKGKSADEVCALINRHNGEATPFNNHETLFVHPQVKALDMVHTVEQPGAGPIPALLHPWLISDLPKGVGGPAPTLGQHTREVLQGLGYAEKVIESLSVGAALPDAGVPRVKG